MASFRETLTLYKSKELSSAALSLRLATATADYRDSLIRAGRASPKYETYVDGSRSDNMNTVKRSILIDFDYGSDAAGFVLGYLIAGSPERSGRYAKSFMVSVNGAPGIPAAQFDATKTDSQSTIIIYNTQPYSRKVDVQMIGTRRLRYKSQQFLFQAAVDQAKKRFGNQANIVRIYNVNFLGKYVTKVHQFRLTGKNAGKIARPAGTSIDSPCVRISPIS